MAFNCRLTKNIILDDNPSGQTSCGSKTISAGGIRGTAYLFNISDVQNLIYSDDNRSDDTLFVDTIVTREPFYQIDGTSFTYNQTIDENQVHTHTLTLVIGNSTAEYEDLLADALGGKYLVCFKINTDDVYRGFGWDKGASMTYTFDISSDAVQYNVTFEYIGEMPLLSIDKSNFNIKNKVYDPIFKPLYDIPQCQKDASGNNNGFLLASYVTKVNSAGQALDKNNKLCEYSKLKQDAYKLNGLSDGGYNILGSYGETASFDGKPIKIYDTKLCPKSSYGSITASVFSLVLGDNWSEGNLTSSAITISSDNPWEIYSTPSNVSVSPISGLSGNTVINFKPQGSTTNETVLFKNVISEEIIGVDCKVYYPLPTSRFVSMNDKTINASIVVNEENAISYSAKTSSYLNASRNGDEFTCSIKSRPSSTIFVDNYLTIYPTDYPSMKLYIDVNVQGFSNSPNWYVLESYCLTDAQRKKLGKRYTKMTDINPQSPSYGTVSSRTEDDSSCAASSPTWVITSEFCETDSNGANTGYRIIVQQDVNIGSTTYGDTKEERTLDSTCGKQSSEPHWVQNEEYQNYCIQEEYNGFIANNGLLHIFEIDDNQFSPTAGEERERDIEDLEHCPLPSLEPTWTIVTEVCQIEDNKKGSLVYNGLADVTYQDTNKYSPSYLSFSSSTVTSENCKMQEEEKYEFNLVYTSLGEMTGKGDEQEIPSRIITSTKNGTFIGFSVESCPTWITTTIEADYSIKIIFTENFGAHREGELVFVQDESSLKYTIKVEQAKKGGEEDPSKPDDYNTFALLVGVTNLSQYGISPSDYSNFGRFEVVESETTLPLPFISIRQNDAYFYVRGLTKDSYTVTLKVMGLSQSNANVGFVHTSSQPNSDWTISGADYNELFFATGTMIINYIPLNLTIQVKFVQG